MDETTQTKLDHLERILSELQEVMVAFSGGTDSTFLVKAAQRVLQEKVLAVTIVSPLFAQREIEATKALAATLRVSNLLLFEENILSDENFLSNPLERCYFCKRKLFEQLKEVAKQRGILHIVEGTHFDDRNDYRPGRKALQELDIRSPLLEARLTKAEIRGISQKWGLPTFNKPSTSCLATRIPYGTRITQETLRTIEQGEEFLHSLGFSQVRLRHHLPIARLEVTERDLSLLFDGVRRSKIVQKLKSLGYQYVTVDLEGYQTGSMNRCIEKK